MTRPIIEAKCMNPNCASNKAYVEKASYYDAFSSLHEVKIYECIKCHERWRGEEA